MSVRPSRPRCPGLGFSDQRRQALAQIGSGRLVEAVVDLAGVERRGFAANGNGLS